MNSKWIRAVCAAMAAGLCLCAAAEENLTGKQILEIEQKLYALGYHDENCDAQIDDGTRKSLISFQTANGLEPTGEPDNATIALLESGECVTCHDYLSGLVGKYAELPILQSGSAGESVSQIQRKLKDLGYFSGSCDGVFGTETMTAVRRFQMANGMEQSGMADRSTQMRLLEDKAISWQDFLTAASAAPGDSGVYVRLLQRRLAEMGYFQGECTGGYGDLTQRAVAQFQSNNALEETGIADPSTCEALYSDSAAPLLAAGTLREGDSTEAVTDLQSQLASLGYFDRNITGIYGATTQTAVRLFQMANQLPSTGEADPATLDKLSGGSAVALDSVRESLLEQVRGQDETARAVVSNVASGMRGHSFEADDEDLFEGFAFVQYVCVAAGIPVVAPEDIMELINEKVEDESALHAGDIIVLRIDAPEGRRTRLAVSTGGGRAVYATPDSGWVLESPISNLSGSELYRWALGE